MQSIVLVLAVVFFALVVSHPSHDRRHHHKHQAQHLVPQPMDIDPSKMSRNEVEKLHKQLGEYLERTASIGFVDKKADFSEQYENERRRYRNGKKSAKALTVRKQQSNKIAQDDCMKPLDLVANQKQRGAVDM
uniref:Uncharacterized protein n=1 Tax=Steinernema glaseri TaxID=37863 RepID=A0A1I7XZQ0_9BILA